MNWQPIENAPKDESWILATNGKVAGGFPQVVYWLDGRWHVDDCGFSYHPDFFTHWMPVPEAPVVRRCVACGKPALGKCEKAGHGFHQIA